MLDEFQIPVHISLSVPTVTHCFEYDIGTIALSGQYVERMRPSKIYVITDYNVRNLHLPKLLRSFSVEPEVIALDQFREEIEWGEWPGRPANFEWNYVESEGPQDLRFDWKGGSMWYRAYSPPGEVEGNVPKHLVPHLKKKGFEVYS